MRVTKRRIGHFEASYSEQYREMPTIYALLVSAFFPLIAINSTSKIKTELGGITGGYPRAPYP